MSECVQAAVTTHVNEAELKGFKLPKFTHFLKTANYYHKILCEGKEHSQMWMLLFTVFIARTSPTQCFIYQQNLIGTSGLQTKWEEE
jgi:hypothetical protein